MDSSSADFLPDLEDLLHKLDFQEHPYPLEEDSLHILGKLPIRNQGSRRTSAVFAILRCYELMLQTDPGKRLLSPQFLYWAVNEKTGGLFEKGTSLIEAAQTFLENGACREEVFPYQLEQLSQVEPAPPHEAIAESKNFRPSALGLINPSDIESLKNVLLSGKPIGFVIPVYKSWYESQNCRATGRILSPTLNEVCIGHHAVTLIGFAYDSRTPGGGYFIFDNSWGRQWGALNHYGAGRGILSFNYATLAEEACYLNIDLLSRLVPPFEVHQYTFPKLTELFVEKAKSTSHDVNEHAHSNYYETYFKELEARTIVVENNYVDHDFLEDFSGYYVRCFQDYGRYCTRLHFFTREFSRKDFQALLKGTDPRSLNLEDLQAQYLGFIIIKPLPKTFVGRTCLSTYPKCNSSLREYPITRPYEVSLFGLPLEINSIAFQEQDQTTGACATSALWSVFHATSRLFQHTIPSPIEITKAAMVNAAEESRILPNIEGLTNGQIAQAIRSVGLEPFLVKPADPNVFKATVYAYLRAHIPVVMTGLLLPIDDDTCEKSAVDEAEVDSELLDENVDSEDEDSDDLVTLARHAVAITGYGTSRGAPKPYGKTGFLLEATRLTKVYAHDDQVGPFARMLICDRYIPEEEGEDYYFARLSTSFFDSSGMQGAYAFMADALLIPLVAPIRIPFLTIYKSVKAFEKHIEKFRAGISPVSQTRLFPSILSERLRWDIYLTSNTELKLSLLQNKDIKPSQKLEAVTKPLPRFLWRATATIENGRHLLDLIFDTTDTDQGRVLIQVIEYDRFYGTFLRTIASYVETDPLFLKMRTEAPVATVIWSYFLGR